MHWFRSARRFGAGLGLFALLLQLAVSFDHIHAEDLLPQSVAGVADQGVGKAPLPAAGQDREAPGSPHEDCPICAVMHLAGTIVMPAAPALSLPTQFATLSFVGGDFAFAPISRRLPFQTRAPPIA
jgi:Protein of unknown function (DUF2946)